MKTTLLLARIASLALCAIAVCGLMTGCSSKPNEAGHTGEHSGHGHSHTPPHGGTAVELGNEHAHVEFVQDKAAGKLTAYILSAHMDDFVKLPATSIEIVAKDGGKEHPLTLKAVANAATGETVGNSAQFEAEAEWLKTTSSFDGVLKEITVRGSTFTNIGFKFPKAADHKH